MKKHTPTVLAIIAVFLALGGTAFAGGHYLITRSSQIKPSVLHQLKGAHGTAGAQGPAGAPGPAGPVALSALTEVVGPKEFIGEGVGSSVAVCPAGSHAVSGGGSAITLDGMAASEMTTDHQAWFVIAAGTSITSSVQAIVYCAGAGQAVAASRSRSDPRAAAQVHALEAQLQAAK